MSMRSLYVQQEAFSCRLQVATVTMPSIGPIEDLARPLFSWHKQRHDQLHPSQYHRAFTLRVAEEVLFESEEMLEAVMDQSSEEDEDEGVGVDSGCDDLWCDPQSGERLRQPNFPNIEPSLNIRLAPKAHAIVHFKGYVDPVACSQ